MSALRSLFHRANTDSLAWFDWMAVCAAHTRKRIYMFFYGTYGVLFVLSLQGIVLKSAVCEREGGRSSCDAVNLGCFIVCVVCMQSAHGVYIVYARTF